VGCWRWRRDLAAPCAPTGATWRDCGDGFVVVTLFWTVLGIAGALPL